MKAVHVSCTVQKGNFHEFRRTETYREILREVPEVFVRFKFAHGPWGVNHFVLSEGELSTIIRAWKSVVDESAEISARTNLREMLRVVENQVSRQGIVEGRPVWHLYDEGLKGPLHGHPCRVLRATMFIDAKGDVYPCCYLFNDNLSDWAERDRQKVGSWRELNRSGTMPNALASIWHGEVLRNLRTPDTPYVSEACGRCTRHHRQNLFLAKLDGVLTMFGPKLPDELGFEDPADEFSEPLWL
jgi:hypothetical protein